MDVTGTLRADAFRPFATLVAPGALALAPWAILGYSTLSQVQTFWDKHPIATGMGLFIASVGVGLACEDVGARIEASIDEYRDGLDESHTRYWHRYQLLILQPEPIGQRYLRTVLFRLKFELGVLSSLLLQLPGWLLLGRAAGAPTGCFVAIALTIAGAAVWLRLEALDSAEALAGIRKRLVDHFEALERRSPEQDLGEGE